MSKSMNRFHPKKSFNKLQFLLLFMFLLLLSSSFDKVQILFRSEHHQQISIHGLKFSRIVFFEMWCPLLRRHLSTSFYGLNFSHHNTITSYNYMVTSLCFLLISIWIDSKSIEWDNACIL